MLAPVSGRLLDKFGAVRPILSGCIFVLISIFCFNFLLSEATIFHLALIYMIFTLGQGFTVGNIMVNGLKFLPENLKADGNAICNTLQQLAGAIGTSIIATIVAAPQKIFPNSLVSATAQGSANAFVVLLVMSIILFLCMSVAFKKSSPTK